MLKPDSGAIKTRPLVWCGVVFGYLCSFWVCACVCFELCCVLGACCCVVFVFVLVLVLGVCFVCCMLGARVRACARARVCAPTHVHLNDRGFAPAAPSLRKMMLWWRRCWHSSHLPREPTTQKLQNPLIEEYPLNYNRNPHMI